MENTEHWLAKLALLLLVPLAIALAMLTDIIGVEILED